MQATYTMILCTVILALLCLVVGIDAPDERAVQQESDARASRRSR